MDAADMVGLGQVALRAVGWGTEFVDLDADGWLDLLVANGSTFESSGVPSRLRPQPFFMFWNRKGKSFHNLAPLSPALSGKHVGRGLAVADYDRDGDLDFVVVNHAEDVQLFRREGLTATKQNNTKAGNWVIFKLRSRSGKEGKLNGRGEGSRLTAVVNGRRLHRSVGGPSYLSQSSMNVHFGLGAAQKIDSLEVSWHGGEKSSYTGIEANSYYELTEGESEPRRLSYPGPSGTSAAATMDERQQLKLFWQTQRAAVHAMKVDRDLGKAIALFKNALELNPLHEDSLHYLGQALIATGQLTEALQTFEELTRVNPSSHRGYRQVGFLRARTAKSNEDLSAAEKALERALEINAEETGVLLLLGEIDLMQGQLDAADKRFDWVFRSNPRSVASLYLRAYIAWKKGSPDEVKAFLLKAQQTGQRQKKPVGSTAEGDVQAKMHRDESLLSAFFKIPENTITNLDDVFEALDKHLKMLKR
jgi:tetratricopeptide (TPR) repeat protein